MEEKAQNTSTLINKRWEKETQKQEMIEKKMLDAREQKTSKAINKDIMKIQNIISQHNEYVSLITNFENVKIEFPFLYYIFQTAVEKIKRKGSLIFGIRYSLYIVPYILLLSFFGKKLAIFLNLILAIPTWRTISTWRQKYISKYKISLDGKQESINNMIDSYITDMEDNRVVLAIDAVSVSAQVSVSEDGEVKGLLNTHHTNDAQKILSSSEEFAKFVDQNQKDIIRYFFVIYACPLSQKNKAFPVAIIPKSSGNASKDIVTKFENILKKVGAKLKVVGTSFDGDSGWLPMAKKAAASTKNLITNALLSDETIQSLDNYVFLQDEDHPDNLPFLVFEDMLHLLKCFRYRLCSGCCICPSVFSDYNNFINSQNFEMVGIPSWLTDNAKYLKMDDGLPLKLFTFENIEKCILSERLDLAYSLLPCTLLKDAVMKSDIDRSTRIEMLSLGYSIVFLYLCELEQYSKYKKTRLQTTSKHGGKNTHLTLMDKKWCSKYLSLCSSLVCMLMDPRALELGALGSHWLEHFFGLIRQVSRGNDSYEKFEYSVYNAVLSHFIEKEIGLQIISPKRVSSSGASISETENVIACDLIVSLKIAAKLHNSLSTGVYCEEIFSHIQKYKIDNEIEDEIQYIMLLLNSNFKKASIRTTISERLAVSVCKSQKRNLSLSSQLIKNTEKVDEEIANNKESLNEKSTNTRRSPRKRKMISNDIYTSIEDEEISPGITNTLILATLPDHMTFLLNE